MAEPLADFPLGVALIFEPEFTFCSPFDSLLGFAVLFGVELFDEFITPFFAAFSAAVEFSLLFGEIGKSSVLMERWKLIE